MADSQLMKIVFQIANSPAKTYLFPMEYFSADFENISTRELFINDDFYLITSQFFTESIFYANPIDCLFCIHKSLENILKAALTNKQHSSEKPSSNKILAFDDLFSLFIGILAASDLPDLSFLSWFVTTYTPVDYISPQLIYAQTNLEALQKHIYFMSVQAPNQISSIDQANFL